MIKKDLYHSKNTLAIILAAGLGNRMKSSQSKVLHKIAGRSMINHVIGSLNSVGIKKKIVVVAKNMKDVAKEVDPNPTITQSKPLGTGNAVKTVLKKITASKNNILVLYGADPLISAKTIKRLIDRINKSDKPAIVALGFKSRFPKTYGRLITNKHRTLTSIIEAKEATREQLAINLCNSGAMIINGKYITKLINTIKNNNKKQEYYLTDIIEIATKNGHRCTYIEGDEEELIGVDTRIDLAKAEQVFQKRARESVLLGGATLSDPSSIFFSWDTKIGKDVIIGPNVIFGPGVTIENNVTIKAFCHIEGTLISKGAIIGPFARLRPKTKIGEEAQIGNFVEVKNTTIKAKVKASHLSYIGDASIDVNTNIGAGTITCNFDGVSKHKTQIGKEVFIGSNAALIAPIKIGDNATIGAGSVITKDIPPYSLGLTRTSQKEISNWNTGELEAQKKMPNRKKLKKG